MRVFFGIILFCGGLNIQAICQFAGGSFDGSVAVSLLDTFSHQFHGSSQDGSASLEYDSGKSELYAGGDGDGYHLFQQVSGAPIFVGGFGGGHILSTLISHDIPPPFTGGQGDGYSQLTIRTLIWTGDFGTNWNDPDNWNQSMIPSKLDIAFIGNGKPNYPLLDGGYLCIGDITCPDGLIYTARGIGIATNGRIDGTNGLRIGNAGEFQINGILNLYGLTAPVVFRNLDAGQLILGSGAQMMMQR